MKLWAREFQNGHVIKDAVTEDTSDDTRTHKVLRGLQNLCHDLDLAVPIWLSQNEKDFKARSRCRFTQDSFVEEIPFDYLDFRVLKEDDPWD